MPFSDLHALVSPKTIAIVGASRTPGKVGHTLLQNLLEGGFEGEIIPVTPNAESISGLECFPTIKAVGKVIDLALLAVPAPVVLEVVEGIPPSRVAAITVVGVGFRESGSDGERLEARLVELCHARRIRLLGPNCMGVINTEKKMNASIMGGLSRKGSISVFSQSGAICSTLLDLSDVGIAKVFSIGNKADISEIDLMRYLAQDEQTAVIVGYLEDIRSGDAFVNAAEEVSASKPVVLLKAGTTEAGLKVAASHTGVLSSSEIAYGAAFKRSGVVRADTFVHLLDFSEALAKLPLPAGDRVLIITNAGGPGTLTADAVEKAGLKVSPLCPKRLKPFCKDMLPQSCKDNAVFVLGNAAPERYEAAVEAALDDPGLDAILLILAPHGMPGATEVMRRVAARSDRRKPVLGAFMVGHPNLIPDSLVPAHTAIPIFPSPERAVVTLNAMHAHAVWRRRPPRIVTRFPVNRRRVERIFHRLRRSCRLLVGEVDTKEILRAYGFQVPDGCVTRSVDEAIEAAERIGYPVALKIICPDIVHKSDRGGVRLNVSGPARVRDAFDLLMLRVAQNVPGANIRGVYVEKMAKAGQEVIIGMNRDPQFGPMLMFGLGGIFVETMKDVTFHLAPVTAEEAVQMLESTRSYELLKGKQGKKGVNIEAIAVGIQRISQLTTDFPEIIEFEINPYIVGEIGTEPSVADARMILNRDEECFA